MFESVCVCVCVVWPTKKHIRNAYPFQHKLHWSKPFLVLHPLRSSQIKKQDKPKYSLQRKIENSSFLWHENISGVYIWCETVSIHVRQNSLCSKARKSQIKCEATSGLNVAHTYTKKQNEERNQENKNKNPTHTVAFYPVQNVTW